jgi:hypothetical protein
MRHGSNCPTFAEPNEFHFQILCIPGYRLRHGLAGNGQYCGQGLSHGNKPRIPSKGIPEFKDEIRALSSPLFGLALPTSAHSTSLIVAPTALNFQIQ